MVTEWRPFWRVCHRPKLQHPASDPTTVFLRPVFGQLGTVSEVRVVRIIIHSFFPVPQSPLLAFWGEYGVES